MSEPKALLSIGEFAGLTRLSIKALRLYDQLGILQPRRVDASNGYCYYGVDQVPTARMIRNMRDMDMPLATIRRMLVVLPVSQAQAELLVREHVDLRERQLQQIRSQARQFTKQLKPEANTMSLEVTVKDIPTQRIISITRRHTVDGLGKQEEQDIGTLFEFAGRAGVEVDGAPFGIYHGPVSEQEDGPVETCIALKGTIAGQAEVAARELSGGKAACVLIEGAMCHYPELLAGYDAAADWIQQNGFETAGPPREVWYTGPGADAKWEIVWLFK